MLKTYKPTKPINYTNNFDKIISHVKYQLLTFTQYPNCDNGNPIQTTKLPPINRQSHNTKRFMLTINVNIWCPRKLPIPFGREIKTEIKFYEFHEWTRVEAIIIHAWLEHILDTFCWYLNRFSDEHWKQWESFSSQCNLYTATWIVLSRFPNWGIDLINIVPTCVFMLFFEVGNMQYNQSIWFVEGKHREYFEFTLQYYQTGWK